MPTLTHENLEIKGRNVVALVWDPHDPPYVIKHSQAQRVRREVPWREGEQVRAADRRELLRILEPIALAPALEEVWHPMAHMAATLVDNGTGLQWSVSSFFRLRPRSASPLVIPYGGVHCRLTSVGTGESVVIPLMMDTNEGETPYRVTGLGEVTFSAPGTIGLLSRMQQPTPLVNQTQPLVCEVSFMAEGAVEPATLVTEWQVQDPAPNAWWGYWRPKGPRSIYTM